MSAVSRPSGANARRSSTRSNTSITASPAAMTTASVGAIGNDTVTGESTSTSVATTSTAALVANTLQSKVMALSAYGRDPQPSMWGAWTHGLDASTVRCRRS